MRHRPYASAISRVNLGWFLKDLGSLGAVGRWCRIERHALCTTVGCMDLGTVSGKRWGLCEMLVPSFTSVF